jgi:hypothetical protein
MNINADSLSEFREAFADAMLNLEAKFGIAIELGNIKYSPDSFSGKVEVKNLNSDGRPMLNMIHENTAYWAVSTHLGREACNGGILNQFWILTNGNKVFVEDFNSRRSKYPVIYSYNGTRYRCPIHMLARKA